MIKIYTGLSPHDGKTLRYLRKDHDIFIKQIINKISSQHDDVEVFYGPEMIARFDISGRETQLNDCEVLIDYHGQYRGISFQDRHSDITFLLQHLNREGDILAMTHLNSTNSSWYESRHLPWKSQFKESIQVTSHPFINYEIFRDLRSHVKNPIDKFFFFGNCSPFRNSPNLMVGNPYFLGPGQGGWSPDEYFENIIEFKLGLAISGVGEICYRDIEFMAIGLPFMKFEYLCNLNPPLIPNYHYISIPRIDNNAETLEREGGPEYAQLYIDRFMEVKDDTEFLNFVTKNMTEYYDTYLHPRVRMKHLFSILELPYEQK